MHQHSATCVQARLDEGVGGGEMGDEVLLLDIVHGDHEMLVGPKQLIVRLQIEDREHMCDLGFFHGILPSQSENAGGRVVVSWDGPSLVLKVGGSAKDWRRVLLEPFEVGMLTYPPM